MIFFSENRGGRQCKHLPLPSYLCHEVLEIAVGNLNLSLARYFLTNISFQYSLLVVNSNNPVMVRGRKNHESCQLSVESILSQGNQVNITEVKLACSKHDRATVWEKEIQNAALDRETVFTDGCVNGQGGAGFGWTGAGFCGKGRLGWRATSQDSEIAGIRDALERFMPNSKILVLSDSTSAIAALVNAGKTGEAGTPDLGKAIEAVRERQERLGEDAVVIAWVKSHVGIMGNEIADEEARLGSRASFKREESISSKFEVYKGLEIGSRCGDHDPV